MTAMRVLIDPTIDRKRLTPTTITAAREAADLVRCGFAPGDALEQVLAAYRFSDSEQDTVEQLLSNLDAYRGLRD